MRTVGARLQNVAPGEVEIDLPFRNDLTQHHGYVAAAVLTAIVDVACGYAAMMLMPPGASVLTIEYKVNFPRADRERVLGRCCCDYWRQRKDRGDDVVDDGDGRPDA